MIKQDNFEPFINKTPYKGLRSKDYLFCYHYPDGEYFRVSKSSERLIGYKPEELIGQNQFDYFHPEDKSFVRNEAYEIALSEGLSDSVVYRYRHKTGEYVLLETLKSVLRSDDGNAKILSTMSWLYDGEVSTTL